MDPIDPTSQDHSVEIRYRLLDAKGRPKAEPYGLTSLERAYAVVALMADEPNVERLTIFKVDTSQEPWAKEEVYRKSFPSDPAYRPQVGTGRLRPSGLAGHGSFAGG